MLESHLPGPGYRKRTNAGVTNLGLTKRASVATWKPTWKVLRIIVYYLRMSLLFLRVAVAFLAKRNRSHGCIPCIYSTIVTPAERVLLVLAIERHDW
jgi:hypothetical protein